MRGRLLTATAQRTRTALTVAAIVAAVALVAGAVAFLLTQDDVPPAASAAVHSAQSPTLPPLPQAHWRVHAFASGITGRVTKKELAAAKRERPRAVRVVKKIFDALLLTPADADHIVRSHFEARAAKAFSRIRQRLTAHITRIRTTQRHLHVGIDAESASKAIASVRVVMNARRHSGRVRIKHDSTLWLELSHGSWRVLAWRVDQRPA